MKSSSKYIERLEGNRPFKLKDIIGDGSVALPGKWLYEEVEKGTFNTSKYVIECIGKDHSNTYIKKER